jgi:lipid A 3-O-deacylase
MGLAAHDLGRPEQGGHFAFQLQGGVGAHFILGETVAITLEYRFVHISSAFIYTPNKGINASILLGGLSFFF